MVNSNGDSVPAKVIKHSRDNEGKPISKKHSNPLLYSFEYECILDNRTLYRYKANVIAKNIFTQCDDEGMRHVVLQEITDHKSNKTAVYITNGYVMSKQGVKKQQKAGSCYVIGRTDRPIRSTLNM
jgi:hypothetical protein